MAMGYAAGRAREGRAELSGLQRTLHHLVAAENRGEGMDLEGMEEVKGRLASYFRVKAEAFLFRCRKDVFELGEVCGAFFFRQVRAARERSTIPGLRGEDGARVTDRRGLVGVATTFYREAFGLRGVDVEGADRFVRGLPGRVPTEVAEDLDQPLCLAEVEGAMRGLPGGKVPGIDGLPREFYTAFWGLLGQDFVDVLAAVLDGGLLGATMRVGVLSLLFKKGDRELMGNYRPITLLCADYKILARVVARRLRAALPHVEIGRAHV